MIKITIISISLGSVLFPALADWDTGGKIVISDTDNIAFTYNNGTPNLAVDKIGDDIYFHAVYASAGADFRLYHSYGEVTGQNIVVGKTDEEIPISGDHSFVIEPAVVIDDDHNLHVVWQDSRHCDDVNWFYDNFEIYYIKGFYQPGTPPTWIWGPEVRVTYFDGFSGHPNLDVDSLGFVHVVWTDVRNDLGIWKGLEDVYYTFVRPDFTVVMPTKLTDYERGYLPRHGYNRVDRGFPVISVDDFDNIHVLWVDDHEYFLDPDQYERVKKPAQRLYYKRYINNAHYWSETFDILEEAVLSWDVSFAHPAMTEIDGIIWVMYRNIKHSRTELISIEYSGQPPVFSFQRNDYFHGNDNTKWCGDFSICSDMDGNLHIAAFKFQHESSGPEDYDLKYWKYDPVGNDWFSNREGTLVQDGFYNPGGHDFLAFRSPTLTFDEDGHIHVLYSAWRHYKISGEPNEKYDYVYYENNWNPGSRMGSPPAPPTDLTADSDTRGKTGSVDLTWTLSINDPEYWNELAAEPAPLASPGPTATEVLTPSDVSGTGVTKEASTTPLLVAEPEKLNEGVASAGPTPAGSPDASSSIIRPDELDVEEYWVIVHYYPGGAEGRTEEYLAGGPGTDTFTMPNVPAGAVADYSFSVYCKDAVYDSEIIGPCAAMLTAEAITDGGASSMAFTGGAVPTAYALYQSVPNPNDGSCSIPYDLPETCRAKMTVYDLTGRRVQTVFDTDMGAGAYTCTVSDLEAGVYVYRLEAGDFVASRKMVVIK